MYIRYSQKTHRLEGGLFIPYYLLEDFIEIAEDFLTDNWSDEECKVLAYKLKDFMQPITAEQNNLLSKLSFYKKNPKLKPKYKFNLSHCGISLFCEKKERKFDKCFNCKRYGNTYK